MFFEPFGSRFTPIWGQNFKSFAICRLWVYNAEFFRGLWELVRTSGSTDETKFKKSVLLGHPTPHTPVEIRVKSYFRMYSVTVHKHSFSSQFCQFLLRHGLQQQILLRTRSFPLMWIQLYFWNLNSLPFGAVQSCLVTFRSQDPKNFMWAGKVTKMGAICRPDWCGDTPGTEKI